MVTLKGKFKGETGLRWHCVPISLEGPSGIPFKLWLARLLRWRVVAQGRRTGPLFASDGGKIQRISDLDPIFVDLIDRVRAEFPGLISGKVESGDYSLRRSGRRGAATEATNLQVPADTMHLLGRWRRKEAARGTEPGLPIRQAYTQVSHALPAMLAYTKAL